ncbi:hypothetical protein PCIT_b0113 [Pseudoalteromonas citrea]|uniref:Uncharacterized protein n=1 Tax=Pseudoalteromonas citrea TaxID=43655 RepID=A0AAD4ADY6_9GAMM|nr:hypothetical protein PCIT_b0113 [Pseudoalteromonas citrea]
MFLGIKILNKEYFISKSPSYNSNYHRLITCLLVLDQVSGKYYRYFNNLRV